MEFVQKFTPPDFRAKNFTPSISPNFNSFSKKKHKKMSENGEIWQKFYTATGSDGTDTSEYSDDCDYDYDADDADNHYYDGKP